MKLFVHREITRDSKRITTFFVAESPNSHKYGRFHHSGKIRAQYNEGGKTLLTNLGNTSDLIIQGLFKVQLITFMR